MKQFKKRFKKSYSGKYQDPDVQVAKDRAYLRAFRDGFDPRFCSSKVKRFSAEEIEMYERERGMHLT